MISLSGKSMFGAVPSSPQRIGVSYNDKSCKFNPHLPVAPDLHIFPRTLSSFNIL